MIPIFLHDMLYRFHGNENWHKKLYIHCYSLKRNFTWMLVAHNTEAPFGALILKALHVFCSLIVSYDSTRNKCIFLRPFHRIWEEHQAFHVFLRFLRGLLHFMLEQLRAEASITNEQLEIMMTKHRKLACRTISNVHTKQTLLEADESVNVFKDIKLTWELVQVGNFCTLQFKPILSQTRIVENLNFAL